MKRKKLVTIHIVATVVAMITILTFFISSVVAELNGDETIIKNVKEAIFFALPVMLIAMPALGISGNKLAGKSSNPTVAVKRKRMKFVFLNGIALIGLASFLYYRSHYQSIDTTFLTAQVVELCLGLTNLIFIGLNIKSGFQLSARMKRKDYISKI